MPAVRKLKLPSLAVTVSLTLGLLAALAIVGFNELGYRRSAEAVDRVALYDRGRDALHVLLQLMLDAETGQRGYLLTGDGRYLAPYQKATESLGRQLIATERLFAQTTQEVAEFHVLSNLIARKLEELQTTVALRSEGNEEAWKAILRGEAGNNLMAQIRAQVASLGHANLRLIDMRRDEIVQSLRSSRAGIALTSVIALLAFYQTVRQARALALANQSAKEELERERDLLDRMVKDRTARLAELATYLQNVREEERAHLARELHDELGSLLTAAKLDVARLKSKIGADPLAQERIAHLIATLNSGIALKRRIIEDLRPSALSNLGLTASLDILAREFGERLELEVSTDIEEVALDAATQLTVYRLVQESLTNISKYADARTVTVSVRKQPDQVVVEVRDDGNGFVAEGIRPTASGLAGMRHRVEAAGGRLEVDSRPGKGTRIAAGLPLAG